MKKKIFLLFLHCSALLCYAQDTIYKIDGTSVIAKVTDVDKSIIRYTVVGQDYSTDFTAPRNQIGYIVFRNGNKEYCNYNRIRNKHKFRSKEIFNRNIVALNMFEFMFSNLTMSYEHILPSGKFSVKVPVSVGLGGPPNEDHYRGRLRQYQFAQNRLFAGGLELNVYPAGQAENAYYLGISSIAGNFYYIQYDYSGGFPQEKKLEGLHLSVMVHIGVNMSMTERYAFKAKIAAGMKSEKTNNPDYTLPRLQPDIGFAYRF